MVQSVLKPLLIRAEKTFSVLFPIHSAKRANDFRPNRGIRMNKCFFVGCLHCISISIACSAILPMWWARFTFLNRQSIIFLPDWSNPHARQRQRRRHFHPRHAGRGDRWYGATGWCAYSSILRPKAVIQRHSGKDTCYLIALCAHPIGAKVAKHKTEENYCSVFFLLILGVCELGRLHG